MAFRDSDSNSGFADSIDSESNPYPKHWLTVSSLFTYVNAYFLKIFKFCLTIYFLV